MICYPNKCKQRFQCAESLWYSPRITPCHKIQDNIQLTFIYDMESLTNLQLKCLLISLDRGKNEQKVT
jgi:hypothetical protein